MTNRLTQHPAFEAPMRYAQFAKNGVWEEAWRFNKSAVPESPSILAYLNDAEEVAFEVFFGDAFFGLRFSGSAEKARQGALACVKAYRLASAEVPFFSALSALLNAPAWGQTVVCAEVGAVNFWKSVGPYRLPDLQAAKSDPTAAFQDLLATPVGLDCQHPKALELVCSGQLQHWFGLPISKQVPPYGLSAQLFASALFYG